MVAFHCYLKLIILLLLKESQNISLCFYFAGYSVFVVGVADVDMSELRLIGSKPSERHVFVVDDYDAFAKIQDNLITFICETATSSKTAVTNASM